MQKEMQQRGKYFFIKKKIFLIKQIINSFFFFVFNLLIFLIYK